MTLGSELRAARGAAGLSLVELGRRVGVSAATLSRWETGRGVPAPEVLRKCVEVLQLPPDTWRDAAPSQQTDGGAGDAGGRLAWREFEPLRLDPVLGAALKLFLVRGYHGTTVRDVAQAADMSVPNVYHYYESKQALLVAIMERTMGEFAARCEMARKEGRDATERFSLLVECFALFHSYRRELAFIGASEMRSLELQARERIAAVRNGCQRMIDIELAALDRDGRLRTSSCEDAGRAVVTMLVGIANWYRIGGRQSPREVAECYVEFAAGLVGLDAPEK